MSDKKEVCFEGKMELKKAIAYLEQLLASLKEGRVVVENGKDSLVLEPTQVVEVEVEAERKKNVEKFSLELEWNCNMTPDKEPDLKISSTEPAPDPQERVEETGEELEEELV